MEVKPTLIRVNDRIKKDWKDVEFKETQYPYVRIHPKQIKNEFDRPYYLSELKKYLVSEPMHKLINELFKNAFIKEILVYNTMKIEYVHKIEENIFYIQTSSYFYCKNSCNQIYQMSNIEELDSNWFILTKKKITH